MKTDYENMWDFDVIIKSDMPDINCSLYENMNHRKKMIPLRQWLSNVAFA